MWHLNIIFCLVFGHRMYDLCSFKLLTIAMSNTDPMLSCWTEYVGGNFLNKVGSSYCLRIGKVDAMAHLDGSGMNILAKKALLDMSLSISVVPAFTHMSLHESSKPWRYNLETMNLLNVYLTNFNTKKTQVATYVGELLGSYPPTLYI